MRELQRNVTTLRGPLLRIASLDAQCIRRPSLALAAIAAYSYRSAPPPRPGVLNECDPSPHPHRPARRPLRPARHARAGLRNTGVRAEPAGAHQRCGLLE